MDTEENVQQGQADWRSALEYVYSLSVTAQDQRMRVGDLAASQDASVLDVADARKQLRALRRRLRQHGADLDKLGAKV